MNWTHNYTLEEHLVKARNTSHFIENIIDNKWVQSGFCIFYTVIFVLGLLGNLLVCFVVIRNKAMQTVTNLFITNLALSDILLCIFAVPFTPLYSFRGTWGWGSILCHIMPFAQGCSVYISTLTLMSIAIDRFFVIIYPFRPRMKIGTCVTVIFMIWTFAVTVTMPYALFMTYYEVPGVGKYCEEMWPSEELRQVFGSITSIMQFVLPFIVIAFCYTCVSFKLNDRAKAKAAAKNSRKEEIDKYRKRRTNQMLIAMVTIFGLSWLPLNVINLCNDYYKYAIHLKYYLVTFFICHGIAMSSTCYNPFIYAWMNENFRKEFKQLIPCMDTSAHLRANIQLDPMGPSEKTFNGNTTTDSYLGSSSQRGTSFRNKRKPSAAADVERSGVELNEDLLTVDVKHCHISTSYNLRRESVKLRLINEESFDGTPPQSQF
ncbi:prolactin-releasing peptide receptor-like [Cydia amplana]|uniref:prolactin-releasing peptide receptor-like n=1 Tax=Cydia amplana TaxID=1869771 RepID=UPI002FE5CA04